MAVSISPDEKFGTVLALVDPLLSQHKGIEPKPHSPPRLHHGEST